MSIEHAPNSPIVFDSHLAHVLGFRHGPRARRPPDGDVWDFDCDLNDGAQDAAKRIVSTYFPHLVPAVLRCSPLPRSRKTLELMWPNQAAAICEESRLGIQRGEEVLWKALEGPNAYDMTVQEMLNAASELVTNSGWSFLLAGAEIAKDVGTGGVGAMCSHSPFADVGTMLARRILGIGGLLPEQFQSGAFVHLGYDRGGNIRLCNYHPVPPAEAVVA